MELISQLRNETDQHKQHKQPCLASAAAMEQETTGAFLRFLRAPSFATTKSATIKTTLGSLNPRRLGNRHMPPAAARHGVQSRRRLFATNSATHTPSNRERRQLTIHARR